MPYVRCINNQGYEASLTLGAVYKVLPSINKLEEGSLRIVDNSGEDYLFDPRRFEPLLPTANVANEPSSRAVRSVTAHVPDWIYGVLHAEALAENTTVSTLLRHWIEERLDLPTAA